MGLNVCECGGKAESPPMLFPAHLQARELCLQTYSLSLPLEWSQVTHIPASIKSGGAYKPEKSAFYSTFARQLCDDTRLPRSFVEGELSFLKLGSVLVGLSGVSNFS